MAARPVIDLPPLYPSCLLFSPFSDILHRRCSQPLPTSRPTSRPTTPPTPEPSAAPIPTAQLAMDANTWFCGIDWDWIEDHCDEAIPCPQGDAVNCPANWGCYASTPCTLHPTADPTSTPTGTPSGSPTPRPTASPWSEVRFEEFLYAPSDGEGGRPIAGEGGRPSSSEGGGGEAAVGAPQPGPALAVNEKLELYANSFQYHFFCGTSWSDADKTCGVFCPSGDESECPYGEECYANTLCDSRDTSTPTVGPGPGAAPNTAPSDGGEVCALCDEMAMDSLKFVSFQSQTAACGDIDQVIRSQNILVGSVTCDNARRLYGGTCCFDECQLCRTPEGGLMDMLSEHVVKQGGYEASCEGISNILGASSKEDSVCIDAQAQFGRECCYRKCSLCGENTSTDWYATAVFQGLTTTCLGLDFMLRAEQIADGSERCSELQGTYMDSCCHPSQNSCQLCEAGDQLYQVHPTKTVTTEDSQSTFTTCTVMNDSLSKLGKSNHECLFGKQTYFRQCCDLSNLISLVDTDNSPAGDDGGNALEDGSSSQQPSPGAAPSLGSSSSTNSATNGSPPSRGQSGTTNNDWPDQSEGTNNGWQGSGFSWDRDWDPQSGGCQAAYGTQLSLLGILGLVLLFA